MIRRLRWPKLRFMPTTDESAAANRGTLHLLVGPVGAGKSTYGRQRAAAGNALFLDLDTWMVRLFGDDQRPSRDVIAWYMERRARCRAVMWDVALDLVGTGRDVFLELGLVASAERVQTYQRATDEDIKLVVYVIDAPRELRRQRVARRNDVAQPYTQVVPAEFFERASDAWEPVAEAERSAWGIIDV